MTDRDVVIIEESGRTTVEIQSDDDVRTLVVDSEQVSVVSAVEQGPQGAPGTSGDLHFVQQFTSLATVPCNHQLGKKPAVTVIDSAGDEVEGEVEHVSINDLVVRFSAATSGQVILN